VGLAIGLHDDGAQTTSQRTARADRAYRGRDEAASGRKAALAFILDTGNSTDERSHRGNQAAKLLERKHSPPGPEKGLPDGNPGLGPRARTFFATAIHPTSMFGNEHKFLFLLISIYCFDYPCAPKGSTEAGYN